MVLGLAVAIITMTSFMTSVPIDANSVARWLHLFFGVLWIGLLYYFNFVQVPSMPKIADEHKPAISGTIAPSALFFFRWAAALTVVTGLWISMVNGYMVDALTFAGEGAVDLI